jgi:hypothetical protein
MNMAMTGCWDCPLGLLPAFIIASIGAFLAWCAVRFSRLPSVVGRMVAGASLVLAVLCFIGLSKYSLVNGLAYTTGPTALPRSVSALFLATWYLCSLGLVLLARHQRAST